MHFLALIFLIITLVQFVVIAKGAERVAEVSARFSLDAMPGRQMSIDADVRAGMYDYETARQKRLELQVESRFPLIAKDSVAEEILANLGTSCNCKCLSAKIVSSLYLLIFIISAPFTTYCSFNFYNLLWKTEKDWRKW